MIGRVVLLTMVLMFIIWGLMYVHKLENLRPVVRICLQLGLSALLAVLLIGGSITIARVI